MLISSCYGDDNPSDKSVEDHHLSFSSFKFEKDRNPYLKEDVVLTTCGIDTLYAFIPELEYADSLIATYAVDDSQVEKVTVGGVKQESGATLQDYSRIVQYDLIDYDGRTQSIYIKVLVANAIPRIDVETEGAIDITSKINYVNANIRITNCPERGTIISGGKIRGRGNASWSHPKKSYKLKFSSKQNPFGFPENKDWVLLGNYTDRSLMRTAYMCEVSKALGIKYTVNYQYVDFYLNYDYQGTYMFTEHIKKDKNRVDIEDDGFFIEGDNYYQYEPLFFVTDSFRVGMTFKYPDADDGKIVEGDDNFNYIKNYMNQVEAALLSIQYGKTDYAQLIDSRSFAKWIIAEEVLANFDSNFFYVLNSRNSKLEMYPLWDFEWSLGLGETTEDGWVLPPNKPRIDIVYWNRYPYTKYLYYDPEFIHILQDEWCMFKPHIPEIKKRLESIRKSLEYTQKDNFEKWPILDIFVSRELVVLGEWNKEVDYINYFFEKRVQWFDNYVMSEVPKTYSN